LSYQPTYEATKEALEAEAGAELPLSQIKLRRKVVTNVNQP
jgi:hypothetical protein